MFDPDREVVWIACGMECNPGGLIIGGDVVGEFAVEVLELGADGGDGVAFAGQVAAAGGGEYVTDPGA
jgi:hypothetical protein